MCVVDGRKRPDPTHWVETTQLGEHPAGRREQGCTLLDVARTLLKRLVVVTSKTDTEYAPWRSALAAPAVHTPPRILVAEDDEAMRNVVVETLRKDGYAVSEVHDGGRLLVTLAREYVHVDGTDLIDLLVSDVRMPVCTGLQILEQLRAVKWPVPVILMTAFGDEAMRCRARSLRALLFDKPFDMDDLRTAVACLLRRAP